MRGLRISLWAPFLPPEPPPVMTMLVAEEDMANTIESAAVEQIRKAAKAEFFLTYEILDPCPELEAFTMQYANFTQTEQGHNESNMALTYYWIVSGLSRVKPTGTIAGSEPWQVSADDLAFTFEQVAQHPAYKGQTVRGPSSDGQLVTLVKGKVERDD